MKELARQTASETDNVSQRASAIQASTDAACQEIVAIGTAIDQVNEYNEIVSGSVEEQAITASSVARNMVEAVQSVNEIVGNIDYLARMVRETKATAVVTEQSAQKLAHTAVELREVVSRFKY